MDRGILIYNAAAGSADEGSGSAALVTRLEAYQVHVEVIEISGGEDPQKAASRALEKSPAFVVVAGGDGTIEAVAKALLGSGLPLGIIPYGTYNNFAMSLGIPTDIDEACEVIGRRQIRAVDVGSANGQPFFECAGFGLDAEVFPLGEEIKEGGITQWFAFLRKAFRYPRQAFHLELDRPLAEAIQSSETGDNPKWIRRLRRVTRESLRIRALMITVSNGPFYGMNFTVAPDAQVDDGFFTVSIFKRFSKLELWWHFSSISAGRRVYSPKTIQLRVKKITVNGTKQIRGHLDGTPSDEWPVEIELRAHALKVFSVSSDANT